MEKALKKELDEVMAQPSVIGVLLADNSGLCISAQGSASSSCAGLVSALVSQAEQLRKSEASAPSATPVVVLETDSCQMIMKSSGGITTAIYKGTGASSRDTNSTSAATVSVHSGR
jgi:hypothetical protein